MQNGFRNICTNTHNSNVHVCPLCAIVCCIQIENETIVNQPELRNESANVRMLAKLYITVN